MARLTHMTSTMTPKSTHSVIVTACIASSPPHSKRILAATHCNVAQKTFWNRGESCRPPEVMVSTTYEPLSEEVTKKLMISSVASPAMRE